jgi:hypothetical protein
VIKVLSPCLSRRAAPQGCETLEIGYRPEPLHSAVPRQPSERERGPPRAIIGACRPAPPGAA